MSIKPSNFSYILPASKYHHAFEHSKELSGGKQFAIWLASIVAGTFTLGTCGVLTFRLLVNAEYKKVLTKKETQINQLFQERVNLNTGITEVKTPVEGMKEIDSHGFQLKNMATTLISVRYPNDIPDVDLSNENAEDVENIKTAISNLEDLLQEKYEMDFRSVGWHGNTSLQRIVWQEPLFLNIIEDPLAVKVLLSRAKNGEERRFGGSHGRLTLSSALLFGLKDSTPSYLLTAAPNWHTKPKVDGVQWNELSEMRGAAEREELPKDVGAMDWDRVSNAIQNVETVLGEILGVGERTVQHPIDQQLYENIM